MQKKTLFGVTFSFNGFSFDQVVAKEPELRTEEDCMEIRIADEKEVKFSFDGDKVKFSHDSNYDMLGSDRLRCVKKKSGF